VGQSLPAEALMAEPVSRHMVRDFVQIGADQTIEQALAGIRQNPPAGRIIYFYVIDAEGRLTGVVPTRRLLLNPLDTKISDIMVREIVAIPEDGTVLLACELFALHRLLALPVVDRRRHVVGIVDVDVYGRERGELEEVERSEDLFQLIGVRLAEAQQANPTAAFTSRFPWLLCNIAGGTLAAFLAGVFEQELEHLVALAMFIPVVLGLAESVSIQSVSLTLEVLHGRPLSLAGLASRLKSELATGALLGIASALLVALIAIIWLRDWRLAVCLLAGIAAGVTAAASIGMAMPNLLRMLRRNPQVAAGPISLAIADMVALLAYFSTARAII
jgi:magnesium transporter